MRNLWFTSEHSKRITIIGENCTHEYEQKQETAIELVITIPELIFFN